MIYQYCSVGQAGLLKWIEKLDPFQVANRPKWSCFHASWKRIWAGIECDNCYAKENLTPFQCGDHYHLVCLNCLLESGEGERHIIQ